jgi:hypothetical protein
MYLHIYIYIYIYISIQNLVDIIFMLSLCFRLSVSGNPQISLNHQIVCLNAVELKIKTTTGKHRIIAVISSH